MSQGPHGKAQSYSQRQENTPRLAVFQRSINIHSRESKIRTFILRHQSNCVPLNPLAPCPLPRPGPGPGVTPGGAGALHCALVSRKATHPWKPFKARRHCCWQHSALKLTGATVNPDAL